MPHHGLNNTLRIAGCAVMLGFILASCNQKNEWKAKPSETGPASAAVQDESEEPASSPSAITLHEDEPSGTHSPAVETVEAPSPSSSPAGVGAANASPDRKERTEEEAGLFSPSNPELASIRLGETEASVKKMLGLPEQSFTLPSDKSSIEMWEYDGLTAGLGHDHRVVYVEVTSSEVATGIRGLQLGTTAKKAAKSLGLDEPERSNVLTVEVTGGSLKLDLDPESRTVISIKLIAET